MKELIYKFFILSTVYLKSKALCEGERTTFKIFVCVNTEHENIDLNKSRLAREEKHVKFIIRRKFCLLSVEGRNEAQQQQIGSDLVKNLRKEMLIFSLANIMGKT